MKLKVFGLVFCFFVAASAFAQEGAQIEMFSPQGQVKDARQVSVRFSNQMVTFGDPRSLTDPFEVVCSEKGTSRWADGRNWIFDFDRNLPAGVSCEFRLKDEVKTLAGKDIGGQKKFAFTTGGPTVRRGSIPYEGSNIEEEQIFLLALDCEPDLDSVRQHVFFSVNGIENNIGIKIIEGKVRQDILNAQGSRLIREARRMPGIKEKQEASIVLIQSLQRFPSKTNVSLIWGKEVKAKSGVKNEQDQILHFQTREPFTAEFNCIRENPAAGCIPFGEMSLFFSAPISKTQAIKIVLKSADGKLLKPHFESESEDISSVRFKGPFPEKTNFIVQLPSGLKDNSGRLLVNADKFPLSVRTGEYPPLAKFSSRFGILELKANAGLPVTMRNVESVISAKTRQLDKGTDMVGKVIGKIFNSQTDRDDNLQGWLRKVAAAKREKSIFSNEIMFQIITLPRPHGGKAFEVVGIPMKKAGLYIVELESAILGKALLPSSAPMFVPTAVLVTNLSAHFKWGRETSLVWVTSLDEGKPVKDAAVTIRNCQEQLVWKGKTDASGIARVDVKLPSESELPSCNDTEERYYDYSESGQLSGLQTGLFVTAQTIDDLTFVHSSWDKGIEPWRFQLPDDKYGSNIHSTHTIFDRTLLRAGDKVSMKHVFRKRTISGFSIPAKDEMPNIVLISNNGSDEKYEFSLNWAASGIAETSWIIPKEAKLGTYSVTLLSKDDAGRQATIKKRKRQEGSFPAGEFRVEEFRVPLMKGTIQPPEEPLVNASKVDLELGVQYLAGGGAGLIPIKLRSFIRPKAMREFAAFENFVFGNGQVKEGLKRRGADIEYDETENSEDAESQADKGKKKSALGMSAIDLNLDKIGTASTTLSPLPKVNIAKEILAEMEFMDPSGEIQTVSAKIPLWPSKYIVGIKPDSWASAKDNLKFYAAVVDLEGKPVAGAQVKVDLFEKKNYSHRKRLVGGFYAYEHTEQTKKLFRFAQARQILAVC